jgi:hypothetical protein
LNYVKQDARKGILITIGDDNVHPELTTRDIRKFFDSKYEGGNISNQVLLDAVRNQYEVYHIIITDGDAYQNDCMREGAPKTADQNERETRKWKELLGPKNVIESISDKVADSIAEIITRHRPFEKANMMNLTQQEWEKKNKENLTDEQWEEVLSYTLCPLTAKYMNKPVVWNGGKRAYEQQAVENYVEEHQKDPITGEKLALSKLVLTPNLNIAQLCADYKPFFDTLPESRRESLVKSALAQMDVNPKKIEDKVKVDPKAENGAAANIGIFAPPKPSAQLPSASANPSSANANPPNLGVAHLSVDPIDGIPYAYKCPIDDVVMTNPVFAEDGHTYGEAGILKWFKDHDTSPKTREVIGKKLTPNHVLRGVILEWQERLASQAAPAKAPNP